MVPNTSGYSGTPLAKKLGIKEGYSIFLHNPPIHYWKLFSDLPPNINTKRSLQEGPFDFIHIFCLSESELHEVAERHKNSLKKNGMLWVSWPKGTSSIETDLKREPVREHMLAIGLVDIKVAAVDEDWSGLKFVYRVKDRD